MCLSLCDNINSIFSDFPIRPHTASATQDRTHRTRRRPPAPAQAHAPAHQRVQGIFARRVYFSQSLRRAVPCRWRSLTMSIQIHTLFLANRMRVINYQPSYPTDSQNSDYPRGTFTSSTSVQKETARSPSRWRATQQESGGPTGPTGLDRAAGRPPSRPTRREAPAAAHQPPPPRRFRRPPS